MIFFILFFFFNWNFWILEAVNMFFFLDNTS